MLLWSFTALLIFCTDKSNLSELGDVIIVVHLWHLPRLILYWQSNLSELGDVIIVVFNVKVRNLHALVIIYRAFNILYWQE